MSFNEAGREANLGSPPPDARGARGQHLLGQLPDVVTSENRQGGAGVAGERHSRSLPGVDKDDVVAVHPALLHSPVDRRLRLTGAVDADNDRSTTFRTVAVHLDHLPMSECDATLIWWRRGHAWQGPKVMPRPPFSMRPPAPFADRLVTFDPGHFEPGCRR